MKIKEILGFKRIALLTVLAAICAVLGAMNYLYFLPQNQSLQQENRSIRNQISNKLSRAETLREDFAQIEQHKNIFAKLETAGFFTNQQRMPAIERLLNIQEYTDLVGMTYSISPARIIETEKSREADQVILQSDINIQAEGMDDTEIYRFAYWVENTFPGQIILADMRVNRIHDINSDVLKKISREGEMPLVKGNLKFVWRTMVDKSEVEDYSQPTPGGGS